jgi:hypothetical protein
MGGALGIWSDGCRADEADVCTVASVPDERDEANALLIVRAANAYRRRPTKRETRRRNDG